MSDRRTGTERRSGNDRRVRDIGRLDGIERRMPTRSVLSPEGLERVLDDMRQRFIAAFPGDCHDIETLVEEVSELGVQGPRASLRQAVHQMSGLAGTVGFPAISRCAAELEALAASPDCDVFEAARARASVEAMRNAFTRDLATLPPWSSLASVSEVGATRTVVAGDSQASQGGLEPPQHTGVLSRARTVLLADDDPEVAGIIDAQMRAAGYQTQIAFDGEDALAAVRRAAPDVLVLDLMLPKLTGFEILAQVQQMTTRPRVIVLSARDREDDVTRAFELGADDYMTKPFNPQELMARVGRLFR